jgi:hypothetical protein
MIKGLSHQAEPDEIDSQEQQQTGCVDNAVFMKRHLIVVSLNNTLFQAIGFLILFGIWILSFGIYLYFGACILVFGIIFVGRASPEISNLNQHCLCVTKH